MNNFYTYLHLRPDGSPFYVGAGHGRRAHRLKTGRSNSLHRKIIDEYGIKNIIISIVETGLTKEEAFTREQKLIAELKSKGHQLCNKTDGGSGMPGFVHTEETCNKISVALTGQVKSVEHRAKLSKATSRTMKGNQYAKGNKYRLGTKHSEETKTKISNAAKGREARLWMQREGKCARIKPDQLEAFIDDGWKRGRK